MFPIKWRISYKILDFMPVILLLPLRLYHKEMSSSIAFENSSLMYRLISCFPPTGWVSLMRTVSGFRVCQILTYWHRWFHQLRIPKPKLQNSKCSITLWNFSRSFRLGIFWVSRLGMLHLSNSVTINHFLIYIMEACLLLRIC